MICSKNEHEQNVPPTYLEHWYWNSGPNKSGGSLACSKNVVMNCWCVAAPTQELSRTSNNEAYTHNLVVGLSFSMLAWPMHQKLEILHIDSEPQANGIDAMRQRSRAKETPMQL